MQQQTCGPLYLEGVLKYAGDDPEKVQLFAAGFISGQAEKVYLGACMAAMSRPSERYRAMVQELVLDIAGRYGLQWQMLGEEEIWLSVWSACPLLQTLQEMEPDSPQWHILRGMLCDVPMAEIDPAFHLRKGYGVPCDREG